MIGKCCGVYLVTLSSDRKSFSRRCPKCRTVYTQRKRQKAQTKPNRRCCP